MPPLRQAHNRLKQRPELTLVKLADGAKDNWTYLGVVLPPGVELIDYYHACDHLKDAFEPRRSIGFRAPPRCLLDRDLDAVIYPDRHMGLVRYLDADLPRPRRQPF